jgi:hypothetical protein
MTQEEIMMDILKELAKLNANIIAMTKVINQPTPLDKQKTNKQLLTEVIGSEGLTKTE